MWPVLLVWEWGTNDRRSSRKRKEADKQQDVNYTAAVKSTLNVGLKLSTVNREEYQTGDCFEEQESVRVCIHFVTVIGNSHSSMHECATQTHSDIHTLNSFDSKQIENSVVFTFANTQKMQNANINLAMFCFGVSCLWQYWVTGQDWQCLLCTLVFVCIC